ncbi:MAG: DUF4118 domain-containing protein [Oscillospiraceae bacterium]|nr:DUF4118 domain-containing protein [Oscillospiraceae bacterium]
MPKKKVQWKQLFPVSWRDAVTMLFFFLIAIGVCAVLRMTDGGDGFASPVFVLVVLMVSRFTNGYLFGLLSAVLGVICVNYVFTYPYFEIDFTIAGYPLSFLAFLAVSVITCALTSQAKQKEELRLENEKVKMRANLLRSVSHDIRTPLTGIVGATSVMLENPGLTEEEQRELLTDVRDDAQWLIQVVENLLSITRVGSDSAQIKKQPEMPEEVLAVAASKFRKRYPDVSLKVSVPDEVLWVPMDAILIEQVLVNLMENAVIHGKTTTEISIKVTKRGRYAQFVVSDNGVGIAADMLEGLFDGSMKHSETSQGDMKRNMGIGLSVCLTIVKAHGGGIRAHNLEQGAEFSFALPLE